MQKLLYVMLISKRKLLCYFSKHPVVVVTSYAVGNIINSQDFLYRVSKWALEIMSFNITYTPTHCHEVVGACRLRG